MRIFLTLLFLVMTIISYFLQVRKAPLKDYLSPGLTALCGLIVLFGVRIENIASWTGIVLAVALFLLAISDFVFERSMTNDSLFSVAIGFGMISGFIIGIAFNLLALDQGLSGLILGGLYILATLAGIGVYRFLIVDAPFQVPIMVYLVQIIILLAGGLASFFVGNPYFGIWGVFLFLSDSLVGLRAFPNPDRPVAWLTPGRLLIAILVLYYSAQLSLVIWSLWS